MQRRDDVPMRIGVPFVFLTTLSLVAACGSDDGGGTGTDSGTDTDTGTSDGTASQPADYLPAAGTLFWTSGDTAPKSFQVTIVDDLLIEGNETVNLALSNPQGGAELGSPLTAVLTIVEDDRAIAVIPTLGDAGKLLMAALVALAALLALRRR